MVLWPYFAILVKSFTKNHLRPRNGITRSVYRGWVNPKNKTWIVGSVPMANGDDKQDVKSNGGDVALNINILTRLDSSIVTRGYLMSIGSISIQCCTFFRERFRSFLNKSELVEPMTRFMFIRVFIWWPSGWMVRHLISNQKNPGLNPGGAVLFFFFS